VRKVRVEVPKKKGGRCMTHREKKGSVERNSIFKTP